MTPDDGPTDSATAEPAAGATAKAARATQAPSKASGATKSPAKAARATKAPSKAPSKASGSDKAPATPSGAGKAPATSSGAGTGATSWLRVTQVRSAIGTKPKHRGTLSALGLRGIGRANVLPDRAEIRGMLARVPHLVEVAPVERDEEG